MSYRFHIQQILTRGSATFVASASDRLMYFLLFASLARLLPREEYGSTVSFFAFEGMLFTFLDLGTHVHLQRLAAISSSRLTIQARFILLLRFFSILPAIGISIVFFHEEFQQAGIRSVLIISSLWMFSMTNALTHLEYGKGNYRLGAQQIVISRAIAIVAGTVSWVLSVPQGIFLAILISGLMQFALSWPRCRSIFATHPAQQLPGFAVMREVAISAFPIGIGMFLVSVYDRVDVLLLRSYLGNSSVAMYAVAYSIYKIAQSMTGPILTPALSDLTHSYNESRTFFAKQVRAYFFLITAIAVIGSTFLLLFPATILTIVYGIPYASSARVLCILAFGLPALLLNNLAGVVLNSLHKERIPTIATFSGAVLNIALNIIFIPVYGIVGAAFVTIATEFLVLSIETFAIIRHLRK